MLTESAIKQIRESELWARYAGKIALINIGLSLLQFLIGYLNQSDWLTTKIISFLISSAISGFIAYQLLQYAMHMHRSVEEKSAAEIKKGFVHLQYYFAIMGLLLLIGSLLMLLSLGIGLLTLYTRF